MTDDELTYAIHETLATLEDFMKEVLAHYRGKNIRCGKKYFCVKDVELKYETVWLSGPLINKDGSLDARRRGGVEFDDIEV